MDKFHPDIIDQRSALALYRSLIQHQLRLDALLDASGNNYYEPVMMPLSAELAAVLLTRGMRLIHDFNIKIVHYTLLRVCRGNGIQ